MTLNEKLKHYGLSQKEYDYALELLKKEELSDIEWALFSSLWSEHCSYKSSKTFLRKLFKDSERLVSEEGENAGVVDLGEGERIAFKMESHNHPSFIEPFQGAATGVGGILRDIFTMGARPMALANYLCFGEPGSDRLSELVNGVVSGISFYGNCVGVPNVTGQTEFHKSYNKNNLVNAFALGYFGKEDKIVSSKIKTPGHLVVYVGAKTGRDGVHGASMASESFDKDSEAKRPTVQIGDPFYEKCLIESCLEVMRSGLVEAVQDMGAAGLTSSSFEMSYGGGLGLEIDLSKVPLRDETLTPEEILLSESQERMLLTCSEDKLSSVKNVFEKWGLDAEVIGFVRSEPQIRLLWKGDIVCEIDPAIIVGKAPEYNHEFKETEWDDSDKVSYKKDILGFYSSIHGASREWIYDQYDQRVGTSTLLDCSEQIGSVMLPESRRSVGIALGCSPKLMTLSPYIGGMDAFLRPALSLSAKGYEPWAVTDCLNFGNPQKPEIMGQFSSSFKGLSQACEAFKSPIISGNVSLFNETENENIAPTPAVGVVGLNTEKVTKDYRPIKSHFVGSNSEVYLLSCRDFVWSGVGADENEGQGELNLQKLFNFSKVLIDLSRSKKDRPTATRVVGRMGLSGALINMCREEIGFELEVEIDDERLFTEGLYEVVLEFDQTPDFEPSEDFAFVYLGKTTKDGKINLGGVELTTKQIEETKKKAWSKKTGV
jgi:phosphoribosylformylglycinamidine synthase